MILDIIMYGNPILRKKTVPIKEFNTSLSDLFDNMLETMRKAEGVGIAAPQVGFNLSAFIVDKNPLVDDSKPIFFINPSIEFLGNETEVEIEGCLSIPQLYAQVKRAKNILVKAKDINGNNFELEASDYLARVIQHEYDHLVGILFIDKVLPYEKKRVEEFLKDLREKNA